MCKHIDRTHGDLKSITVGKVSEKKLLDVIIADDERDIIQRKVAMTRRCKGFLASLRFNLKGSKLRWSTRVRKG
jgi:hypothetical protein